MGMIQTALGENQMQTATTELSRLNSDARSEISILQAITVGNKVDFSEAVPICEKCRYPLARDIEILNKLRRVPIICKCQSEKLRQEEEREERLRIQRRLDKFKVYSLMDKRFEESTFDNWVFREDNRKLYEFGKKYCEDWKSVYENNRGLLLYGSAGNGKTYLSFAIANELYRMGKTVLAISVSRLMKVIMDSYGNHGELGEMDILNATGEASLLILDDLGVEHKTNWSYEKLYSIIDTRYRSKKPTIITTNLSVEALQENLSIVDVKTGRYDTSNRIYDRIIEMCALIKINGESWRIQKGRENREAVLN